jgi:hypothetical protein
LVFTILAVAYLATSLRAPALAARHGRPVLAAGALVLASGYGFCSRPSPTSALAGPLLSWCRG